MHAHIGELFWDGLDPRARTHSTLYPGVPLHGKAPDNCSLIGVIDSGVSSSHPQLAGYLRASVDFGGDGLEDTLGHGTAVALVALFGQGRTNPPCAILSAKVTDRFGNIREEAVVKAIDWMAEQGARVVNLSLGFRGNPDEYKALCAAIGRYPKIYFVAAAGNYGPDVAVFPAACGNGNISSVGALDESGKRADYSGLGTFYAPGAFPKK